MPQGYPNQGQPPTSNQMRPAPITPNQFGPPPTMSPPQFQQQHPPLPNQPPSGMGGVPPYQQGQYPGGQPSYNAPPSAFPPGGQPPPPPSHYPNQSNFSGPPMMPGSQMNGPNTYPSQPPSSGPAQQPYQAQRIDPDMVPNVVRILHLKFALSHY